MVTLTNLSDYNKAADNGQQNTSISKVEPRNQQVIEVNDIDSLENVMASISRAKDNNAALAYVAQAQLQVISTLNSASMALTPVDTLIEQLHLAINAANDNEDQIKKNPTTRLYNVGKYGFLYGSEVAL